MKKLLTLFIFLLFNQFDIPVKPDKNAKYCPFIGEWETKVKIRNRNNGELKTVTSEYDFYEGGVCYFFYDGDRIPIRLWWEMPSYQKVRIYYSNSTTRYTEYIIAGMGRDKMILKHQYKTVKGDSKTETKVFTRIKY